MVASVLLRVRWQLQLDLDLVAQRSCAPLHWFLENLQLTRAAGFMNQKDYDGYASLFSPLPNSITQCAAVLAREYAHD
jgi:hypothetical protein